ncbi:tyrosine-type recombinase/integrase, partial [Dehalogenimonas sp. THU2]|uniref:tyrosine-type recombinase/integrase n=1 Tax=Dehalogenimonas sp. THU2 TaxID=3151121 RepID=UPI0032184957
MVLDNLVWFFEQHNFPTQVHQINTTHIREFLWYLTSETHRWDSSHPLACRKASPSTVHIYYRSMKTFFNWLKREDLISTNPYSFIKPPKQEKKVIQALATTEIQRLFEACEGKTMYDVRNKAILSVLLDSGLRISELTNLKYEDFDQT